jgi:2-methylcitrate synthase
MLHDKAPSELHRKCLNTTLILYAEHEFNASTFAGRVITGTLSDMHSAVTGAIGALRGPLHGGANEAAMELIQKFSSRAEATEGVLGMLERRELIMGFGHRVYTTSDPRNSVNKEMSKTLAEEQGDLTLYEVSEAIEKVMWDEKKLFANADFFAAHRYLSAPGSRAGPRMLWNSARITNSFVRPQITSGRGCRDLCRSKNANVSWEPAPAGELRRIR